MSMALTREIRTASDLDSLVRWSDDLPPAAFDPRVAIRTDLDEYTVGCCGNCWGREETPAEWRIEYAVSEGGSVQHVDVCGRFCAQEKLTELLERAWYSKRVHGLTLRLPVEFAPESDELTRCEGLPGCTAAVAYVVEFESRSHHARRACGCVRHLEILVSYALRFGDRYTVPTVSEVAA